MVKEVRLRTFEDSDSELMENWLEKDYIIKWYLDAEDWLTEISQRHEEYHWLNHFIVMSQEKAIGFCQYYDVFAAKDLEDWYHVKEPGKVFSIDYLIGEEEFLGKGYGKEIVRLLVELIMANEEKAEAIIVQPDKENAQSNGVLLANDFVYDEKKEYYQKNLCTV
ncbi:GNAT family N-acetyltransferase [Enterococcus sp. AZ072]|uniref:GNAT family N-acetyltransferase n=1 Tax=unclassified Enterococcus TaxID=2608891 RepID=UPI003D296504